MPGILLFDHCIRSSGAGFGEPYPIGRHGENVWIELHSRPSGIRWSVYWATG